MSMSQITMIDADVVSFCVTRDCLDELWGLLASATRQYEQIDEDTPLVRVIVEARQMLHDYRFAHDHDGAHRDLMLVRLQAACPHPLVLNQDGSCYCCGHPDPLANPSG